MSCGRRWPAIFWDLADLLSTNARADQLIALSHIQSGGRRLQATLDNLIDLTRFAGRTLHTRPLELHAILADAVEANRQLATEKRIALSTVRPEAGMPPVLADRWALHRIIDNLVANGIKFTRLRWLGRNFGSHAHPEGIVRVNQVITGTGMLPQCAGTTWRTILSGADVVTPPNLIWKVWFCPGLALSPTGGRNGRGTAFR